MDFGWISMDRKAPDGPESTSNHVRPSNAIDKKVWHRLSRRRLGLRASQYVHARRRLSTARCGVSFRSAGWSREQSNHARPSDSYRKEGVVSTFALPAGLKKPSNHVRPLSSYRQKGVVPYSAASVPSGMPPGSQPGTPGTTRLIDFITFCALHSTTPCCGFKISYKYGKAFTVFAYSRSESA